MAWMSIQQAARTLNCSERTIYHRLQRDKLQARRTNGHVEVLVDPPQNVRDPIGELSKVVAAELAMRGNADAALQKLAEGFADSRQMFQRELTRAHRGRQLALAGLILVLGVLVAGWYRLQADHQAELADVQVNYQEQLDQVETRAAAAEGRAGALADHLEWVQAQLTDHQTELTRVREVLAARQQLADLVLGWFGGGSAENSTGELATTHSLER